MNIKKLVDLTLLGLEVSLSDRLQALESKGVNVAVYASNFIPFQLKVTVTGTRSLHVVSDMPLNLEGAIDRIGRMNGFKPATVEDIIALAGVPNLSFDYPTIVCPNASFKDMTGESELTAVHLFLDSPLTNMAREEARQQGNDPSVIRVHTLGLTRPGATFTDKVGFLVVED